MIFFYLFFNERLGNCRVRSDEFREIYKSVKVFAPARTPQKKEIGPTQESYCYRSSKQNCKSNGEEPGKSSKLWQLPLQFALLIGPPVEHGHGHGRQRLVPLPPRQKERRGSLGHFPSFPIHRAYPLVSSSIFVTTPPAHRTPRPRTRPRFDSKTLLAAGCLI